jgi:hypothetical protein
MVKELDGLGNLLKNGSGSYDDLKHGEPGFSAINYKGRQVKHDYIDDGVSFMYFKHMKNAISGRHACLKLGFWCWSNAFQHPLDIRFYLRRRK